MKQEKRKLIKFSNYSLCVTLPKWVIKDLRWNKGEIVDLAVDAKKRTITIFKEKVSSVSKSDKGNTQEESYSRW